jgi:RHS repeat-associated protein
VPQVSYTRGLDLSGSLEGAGGIGGLLARSTHATISPHALNSTAYYHADGNGNITCLLRSDAAANASYKYDPFGRLLSSSGSLATANVMRFSSKPILLSSQGTWGDYYYGYRFYDPESQRWLNRDPIQESGGVNLFAYCGSQPTSLIDPYGESEAFSGVGNAIGGMVGQVREEISGSGGWTTKGRYCVTYQATLLVGGGVGGYIGVTGNLGYTEGSFGGLGTSVGGGALVGEGLGGGASVDLGIDPDTGYFDGSLSGGGGRGPHMGPTIGGSAAVRLSKSCTGCADLCELFHIPKAMSRAIKCIIDNL